MTRLIVHKAVELDKVRVKKRLQLIEPGFLEHFYIAQPWYTGRNLIAVIPNNGNRPYALSQTGSDVQAVDHILMALSSMPGIRPGAYLGTAWAPDLEFGEIDALFMTPATTEGTCRLQMAISDYIGGEDFVAGQSNSSYVDRVSWLPEDTDLGIVKQGNAPVWLAGSFGTLAESFPGNSAQHIANKIAAVEGYSGLILRDPSGTWKAGSGTGGEIIKLEAD